MSTSQVLILATRDIRKQIQINLVRPQTHIMIVTPFVQDVDFGNSRTLHTFLALQRKSDATIELFTTAPDWDKPKEFRRKYALLETYSILGVKILLNEKLHAKAFCFNNDGTFLITLLGSANLTEGGLVNRLELALFSARDGVYHSVMAHVRQFERDKSTEAYLLWKARHHREIQNILTGGTT